MLIQKHAIDFNKVVGLSDSEIIREILSTDRKPCDAERIVKEDALRHAKSHTPNYKEPTEPVTSNRSSAFLALRTYAERNGGEIYSPDAQTFVVRTNVPGFSVVAKETPTGEVSLSLRNGYGNILSSVGAITSTKQFDAFLRKEGLSLSKNTAIDVNLSSSAAYSEIRR